MDLARGNVIFVAEDVDLLIDFVSFVNEWKRKRTFELELGSSTLEKFIEKNYYRDDNLVCVEMNFESATEFGLADDIFYIFKDVKRKYSKNYFEVEIDVKELTNYNENLKYYKITAYYDPKLDSNVICEILCGKSKDIYSTANLEKYGFAKKEEFFSIIEISSNVKYLVDYLKSIKYDQVNKDIIVQLEKFSNESNIDEIFRESACRIEVAFSHIEKIEVLDKYLEYLLDEMENIKKEF